MDNVEIGRYEDVELSQEDIENGVTTARSHWQGWIKCEKFTVFVTADGKPVLMEA